MRCIGRECTSRNDGVKYLVLIRRGRARPSVRYHDLLSGVKYNADGDPLKREAVCASPSPQKWLF